MIAVRMGYERERLGLRRIQPNLFVRQINAALISDFNHRQNLRGNLGGSSTRSTFDITARFPFLYFVKSVAILLLALFAAASLFAADQARILAKVNPLPVALSDDFQFRKTKLFYCSEVVPKAKKSLTSALNANPNNPTAGIAEASLGFERTYRLYGAISNAERNQLYGNYMDFFWRVKRPANVTVRLEYRQEKLRAFVQAREISYENVKGNRKTEFAIIGDDYLQDGRVIAWRCLLIENGHIVAENRSYLWE
jgi:hypothetical protein